jgi:hypothetical protein
VNFVYIACSTTLIMRLAMIFRMRILILDLLSTVQHHSDLEKAMSEKLEVKNKMEGVEILGATLELSLRETPVDITKRERKRLSILLPLLLSAIPAGDSGPAHNWTTSCGLSISCVAISCKRDRGSS